jgi:hypothetical protein
MNERIRKRDIKMMELYGTTSSLLNPELFKKAQQNSYKVMNYKDSGLKYQGSFELYFLEQMENIGLLKEIQRGPNFKYIWNDKETRYYSDFLFRGKVIEIKSTWTYDKNGKNKEMGLKNEAKWQAVRNSGKQIDIIISNIKKVEILEYVKNLSEQLNLENHG